LIEIYVLLVEPHQLHVLIYTI